MPGAGHPQVVRDFRRHLLCLAAGRASGGMNGVPETKEKIR
jgi:hypothetical protein